MIDGTLDINRRGTSDNNPFSVHIGTLSGSSSGLITATSTEVTRTVNVSSNTADGTYAGQIEGTLQLVKSGTSTLTLTGALAHSEGTVINGGTLAITGSLPATGEVIVNSGGTLSGTGTINGPLTVATGGTVAPGNSVGTLTTRDLTLMGGGLLAIELDNVGGVAGSGWDLLDLNGTLDFDPSLTSAMPFEIKLSGTASGFDNQLAQSWLLIDAQTINNSFAPQNFVIDSAALTSPLAGGTFTISRTGQGLFLDFAPLALTPLENWRATFFGAAENSGNGADLADPDQDGLSNLLEYALGGDPTAADLAPNESVWLTLDATQLTLTFSRIADPTLLYEHSSL